MNICIIPARGGSQRIPRKNVKPFLGRPMMAWPIEAARDSGVFDRIIVSTDDDEIAEVARDAGAEVPFKRPEKLSDNHTGTAAVIAHAISWLTEAGDAPEAVCCIYPTAVFVEARHLSEAKALLDGVDFVVPVLSYPHPVQRSLEIRDGALVMTDPANASVRTQDLEPRYHDAGQFYWGRTDAWLSGRPVFGPTTAPYVLSRDGFEDIDTPEDWSRAELMFRLLRGI